MNNGERILRAKGEFAKSDWARYNPILQLYMPAGKTAVTADRAVSALCCNSLQSDTVRIWQGSGAEKGTKHLNNTYFPDHVSLFHFPILFEYILLYTLLLSLNCLFYSG